MQLASVPLCRFGDTRVYVHISFLAAAGILAVSGYAYQLAVFTGSLLFHEFGHLAAASVIGVDVPQVEVWPFGAVARLERPWQLAPASELLVAAAGPFNSSILVALASWLLRVLSAHAPDPARTYPLLSLLVQVNLTLLVVNLMPFLPLDGGRILRTVMCVRVGYVEATRKLATWGVRLGAVAVAGGAVLALWWGNIGWQASAVGLLVFWSAALEREGAAASNILDILNRQDRLTRKKAIPVEEIIVSEDATVAEVVTMFRPSRYHMILVAGKDMKVYGRVSEMAVLEALYKGLTKARMKDLCCGRPH